MPRLATSAATIALLPPDALTHRPSHPVPAPASSCAGESAEGFCTLWRRSPLVTSCWSRLTDGHEGGRSQMARVVVDHPVLDDPDGPDRLARLAALTAEVLAR